MEYFFIFIVVLLIIYATYNQIKVIYYRNFKSFEIEIENFLESHNYQLIEKRNPNKEDWKKSPFEKPPNFKVTLSVIKINGLPVTWTDLKYKVIIGKKENRTKQIWLEIKTTYFQKPKLNFIIK
ncbi:hypothetical protein [Polaribacter aquimarinus]|uniref:Uncharacterized protein n=1 Tax=Polaribacter aquimarinus TaxID=2100726 RepID=A0A2U2JF14_9FLAO|nr:hypothetical protein [Polaribacter aquimarinus]PWG06914.1 hypothetical protein DIS07_03485 [Polaribacter aquimarinus]